MYIVTSLKKEKDFKYALIQSLRRKENNLRKKQKKIFLINDFLQSTKTKNSGT